MAMVEVLVQWWEWWSGNCVVMVVKGCVSENYNDYRAIVC